MWTVFRISLCRADPRAYCDALEILRAAGFRDLSGAAGVDADAPFPAAVLADVQGAPSDVTRAIFGALAEAGLRPLAVSGCPAPERAPAREGARA